MERKYELTDETKEVNGVILHRIRALIDFETVYSEHGSRWEKNQYGTVHAGDLGGWVESEYNLDHEGSAWIANDACVYRYAKVFGNAYVRDAKVFGGASISREAIVIGKAEVYDYACISGNAWVSCAKIHGSVHVYDNAKVHAVHIYDNACIFGNAHVNEESEVCGNAEIYGSAHIHGKAKINGHVKVFDNAVVSDCAEVWGRTIVSGSAHIYEYARVYGGVISGRSKIHGTAHISDGTFSGNVDVSGAASFGIIVTAKIESNNDFIVIGPLGKHSSHYTFYKTSFGIYVNSDSGYHSRTIEEFANEVMERYNTKYMHNKYGKKYLAAIELAKITIG